MRPPEKFTSSAFFIFHFYIFRLFIIPTWRASASENKILKYRNEFLPMRIDRLRAPVCHSYTFLRRPFLFLRDSMHDSASTKSNKTFTDWLVSKIKIRAFDARRKLNFCTQTSNKYNYGSKEGKRGESEKNAAYASSLVGGRSRAVIQIIKRQKMNYNPRDILNFTRESK